MHEILRNLPKGALVLDLGSGVGTVPAGSYPKTSIILLDHSLPAFPVHGFAQADATLLPFPDHTFDAVIANHSLEHMDDLDGVLKEIRRVLQRTGSLYVAVPDGSTLTDWLYRWLFHGGGHVNYFVSAEVVSQRIARVTGLRPVAIRVLHSSLIFLKREQFHPRPPRKLWLLGNGNPRFIAVLNYTLRWLDHLFHTRTSVYGWAFYFGNVQEEIATVPWTNVCFQCGAGHSDTSLLVNAHVRPEVLGFRSYHCPDCGAWNLFTPDLEQRAVPS